MSDKSIFKFPILMQIMKREALKYFLLAVLITIIALFFILPGKVGLSPEIRQDLSASCSSAVEIFNKEADSCRKGFFVFKNDNDRCSEGKCLLEKANKVISACCDESAENKGACEVFKELREGLIDYSNHYCKEDVCYADINVCIKFASVGNALCRVLQDELKCPGCTANPDQNADPQKCQETKSKLEEIIGELKGFSCKTCYPELNYGKAFNCCTDIIQR